MPASKSDSQLIWYHAPALLQSSHEVTSRAKNHISHTLSYSNFAKKTPFDDVTAIKYCKSMSYQTKLNSAEQQDQNQQRYSMPIQEQNAFWNFAKLLENKIEEDIKIKEKIIDLENSWKSLKKAKKEVKSRHLKNIKTT